ncbi:conserved hypothetical protein [[Clostridium] ultunense Esp]|nr:conserved hypothetical protein [[Clostridium] ultunense Esp]
MEYPNINVKKLRLLHNGVVIPAHPLILNESRELDEPRQRRLTRYYIEAGAGGIAIGVHTTQFELHQNPRLYEHLLQITADEVDSRCPDIIKIAGVYGKLSNAVREAEVARKIGYDLALVIPQGIGTCNEQYHLHRMNEIAKIIPIFGFYLQPEVGGCDFSFDFWRQVAEIPNLFAIKVAAFNRYFTIDVMKAVAFAKRREEIALYTGNDDHIVLDLLTPYSFQENGNEVTVYFVGGLLGQWAVWTRRAVQLLNEIKSMRRDSRIPIDLLRKNVELTDINSAIFDVRNHFKGSIAGIHKVLQKDGFVDKIYLLNPEERLSQGQEKEIDRIYQMYPDWRDDDFIRTYQEKWLSE